MRRRAVVRERVLEVWLAPEWPPDPQPTARRAAATSTSGAPDVRRYAFNVAPEEGNLKTLDGEQLATRLNGIKYQYHQAQDLQYDPRQLAGFNLGESLMFLLVLILLGEQALAYATSYHPPARGGTR